MSNDKTTLADVQPGGRVRLGDQAERARFEAWAEERELGTAKCSADGMKGDYADLNTDWCWAAWQAALSAQPSPGGQDALREAAEFARSVLAEIYATYQVKIGPFASQAQSANVKLGAALAARQPVGQENPLMPYVDSYRRMAKIGSGRVSCTAVADDIERNMAPHAARQPMGETVAVSVTPEMRAAFRRAYREGGFWADRLDTALDAMMRAAPPAQAVDLGALRRLSDGWLARSEKLSVTQQRKAGAYWACAKELRDWLDSQAVGNG